MIFFFLIDGVINLRLTVDKSNGDTITANSDTIIIRPVAIKNKNKK